MAGWSLKSFGERVASGLEKGLQDLESSLQQQVQQNQQQQPPGQSLSASPTKATRSSNVTSSSPPSSFDVPRQSTSHDALKSPSELADSAITNLRASLRKGRQSTVESSAQSGPPVLDRGGGSLDSTPKAPSRVENSIYDQSQAPPADPPTLSGAINATLPALISPPEPFDVATAEVDPREDKQFVEPQPLVQSSNSLIVSKGIEAETAMDAPVIKTDSASLHDETLDDVMPVGSFSVSRDDLTLEELAQIPLPQSPEQSRFYLPSSAPASMDTFSLRKFSTTSIDASTDDQVPVRVKYQVHRPAHRRTQTSSAIPMVPSDLTSAYSALIVKKMALDRIVANFVPPLSSVDDTEAVSDALLNLTQKAEMALAEVKRLTELQSRTTSEMEDLKHSSQLEIKTRAEQVEKLSQQLEIRDGASASASTAATERTIKAEAELKILREELTSTNAKIRVEEEKRAKSISLLKAVRQKLVATEKDKEALEKETTHAIEKAQRDKAKFDADIMNARASQEQQLAKLRSSFDRETNSIRSQYERESVARKGQFELEVITNKSSYQKEMSLRDVKISQLESKLSDMSSERDRLFDQLQIRQAQIESSTSHQDNLQGKAGELEHELSDSRDRIVTLLEEMDQLRRCANAKAREEAMGRSVLTDSELRHEAKISGLESKLIQVEIERSTLEAEMTKSLQERLREVERLRAEMDRKDQEYADSVQSMRKRDERIADQDVQMLAMQEDIKLTEKTKRKDQLALTRLQEDLEHAYEEHRQQASSLSDLQTRLDDTLGKESVLRATTKSLRDELRKVQSGILASETQRSKGVGYFASFSGPSGSPELSMNNEQVNDNIAPRGSMDSNAASVTGKHEAEAEVNFEYLRNTLLQFLEHKEMRPHLVRVLAVIMHFTPQETRRLAAKASS